MLPIQAGCLAVTINCKVPSNNGVTVTVIRFVGKVRGWRGDDRWEVSKMFAGLSGGAIPALLESTLLRIDGGEFDKETEKTALINANKGAESWAG